MKVCSIFSQVLKLFSRGGFEKAVKQHKAERHARGFTSWGQFVAMLFCQVGRAHSLSAGDGYSALALAQKEHPDLVLLDLGLPGFATGAVVLKHMRTFPSLAPIPVIVLTGRDLRDYKQPCSN
jgi:CheY-like chemotaxis protein